MHPEGGGEGGGAASLPKQTTLIHVSTQVIENGTDGVRRNKGQKQKNNKQETSGGSRT